MLQWYSLPYHLARIAALQIIAVDYCFYGTKASSAAVGMPFKSTPRCKGGPAYGKMLKAFVGEHLENKNMFHMQTSCKVNGFIPPAVCFISETPFMSCDLFLFT